MLGSLAVAFALAMPAQAPDFGAAIQKEKLAKLSFLVGEWEGKAFFIMPQGRVELESYEKVEAKAGGTAYFITGRHWRNLPSGEKMVVHDAAALLRFDAAKKNYRMVAQLATGATNDFIVDVGDKGYTWESVTPVGPMRYTMTLTDQGEWLEVGDRKVGDRFERAFEMRLKKKD